MPSCSPDPNDIVIHFVNDDNFESSFGLNPRPDPHCEGDEQSASCQGDSPASRCPNFDNSLSGFPTSEWESSVGPSQGWPVHYNRQHKFRAVPNNCGGLSSSNIYIGLVAGDENDGRTMTEFAEARARQSVEKRVDGMLFAVPGGGVNGIGPGTIPRRDLSFRPTTSVPGHAVAAAQEIADAAQEIINRYASTGLIFHINLVLDNSGSMSKSNNWGLSEAPYRAALEALTTSNRATLTVEVQFSSNENYEQWAVEAFDGIGSPIPCDEVQLNSCFDFCDFSDSENLDQVAFSQSVRCSPSPPCAPNSGSDTYTNCYEIDCGEYQIYSGTTASGGTTASPYPSEATGETCRPCSSKPMPTATHTLVMFIYSAFDNTCCKSWDDGAGFYASIIKNFNAEIGSKLRSEGYGDLAIGTATPSDFSWNMGPTCFGLGDGSFGTTYCCKKIWPIWLWDDFTENGGLDSYSFDGFFPKSVDDSAGCDSNEMILPENTWFDTFRPFGGCIDDTGFDGTPLYEEEVRQATHFRQHWYAPIEFQKSGTQTELWDYFQNILADRKTQTESGGYFENDSGLRRIPNFLSSGYPTDIWNVVLVVRQDMFTHDLSEDAKRYEAKCGGASPVQGYPYSWDVGGMCLDDISEKYNAFKERIRKEYPHFNIIETFWQLPKSSDMNQIIKGASGIGSSDGPLRLRTGCGAEDVAEEWWSTAPSNNVVTLGFPRVSEPWHTSNISHISNPGYTKIEDLSCNINCSPLPSLSLTDADPTTAHSERYPDIIVEHCSCQFFHVIFQEENSIIHGVPGDWGSTEDTFNDLQSAYNEKLFMPFINKCLMEEPYRHTWSGIGIETCAPEWAPGYGDRYDDEQRTIPGYEAGNTIIGGWKSFGGYMNAVVGSWTEIASAQPCRYLNDSFYGPSAWINHINSAISSASGMDTNERFCVYLHNLADPTWSDSDSFALQLAEGILQQYSKAMIHKANTSGNVFEIANVVNKYNCHPLPSS